MLVEIFVIIQNNIQHLAQAGKIHKTVTLCSGKDVMLS